MNEKIDCLFIGHNDMNLSDYTRIVRSMGENSCASRDLDLSLCEYNNETCTAIDFFNKHHNQNVSFKHTELSPAIAYLGTFIKRRGYSFDFINFFQEEKNKLAEKLRAHDYLTIAITTTLYVVSFPILEIISFIRRFNSTAKIIIGGPYIASQAESLEANSLQILFKMISADIYVISSQGEQALVNILQALKTDQNLHGIANIAFKNRDSYIMTSLVREQNSLEENMVDWRLFPVAILGDVASLRTSISCPYSCAFCGFPQRGGKYKCISPEVLANNLDLLQNNSDMKFIHFIDDTFNVPAERFKAMLRMMIKNRYCFKWNSTLRCQFIDRESLELMKEAGCMGVFLGIESGSDIILGNMNKNATVDSYRKGLKLLNEYDFITYASFIIGFPGETYSSAKETFSFIQEAKPKFYRTQLWYCDPITPILKEKEKYGIKGSGFQWSHNTMNAETACDIVEEFFLRIDASIWVPQYQFETHNLYYLLNHGYSLGEIRNFLYNFNKLVANKLKYKKDSIIGKNTLESRQLKQNDEFDFT